MRATLEEMKKEAMERLRILKASQAVIDKYPDAFEDIPVTCFNEELGHVSRVHAEALEQFKERVKDGVPFYITESWHGQDIISILFVDAEKEEWEDVREAATDGDHLVYAYSPEDKMGEIGFGAFSIENGMLWRVG